MEQESDRLEGSGGSSEASSTIEAPTEAFPHRPEGVGAPGETGEEPVLLPPLPLDERIGPYRLLKVLGEGGFGTVYLAEQREPLRRLVALKVIRWHRPDRRLRRRFEAERQALARMSHPNVAQVFEAGATPQGLPYIAMEHVPGEPVNTYCDGRRLGLRERLEIFAAVCDGVQHAHQKAVLHRDLKPSNILVTEIAGRPVPKIIDFGIAKALDVPAAGQTVERGMVGTVAYLSPEAIDGRARGGDLDTRADVYTLGVVLYELLAGLRPFGRSSDLDVMNRIVAGDVARPSAALMGLDAPARERVAAARRLDAAGLRRALRGDLDAIVLRAMARRRSDRYASAAELAADVRRHLAHEPVLAGPTGALYPTLKFVRRHRVAVAAGLLAAAALAGGAIATGLEARRANREAARANQEAERANQEAAAARQVADFLEGLFTASDPTRAARDMTARELLDKGAARIRGELAGQPLVQARLLDTIGDVYLSLGIFDQAETATRESVALRRARLAGDSPDLGQSLLDLASVLRQSGRPKEALPVAEEALRIFRRAGEPRLLSAGIAELAGVEKNLGDYPEAERLFKEALALREKEMGPDHERVSPILNNLGNLYYDMGRFADSERVQLRAIAIKERTLGPGHPFLAQSYNNLANVYQAQERYAEAETLHRKALAIRLKTLGPHHPEVGVSYVNLGGIASLRGHHQEAAALFRQALAVWEPTLGPDAFLPAVGRHGLANAERDLEHYAEADALYRRSLAAQEKLLPPGHPQLQETRKDWAKLLRAMGRTREAAELEKAR